MVGSGFALAYGFTNILVALDRWLSVLPFLLLLGGIAMSISNTSVNALLQTHSPEELRGRTVSLYMLAMRGGLSLGALFTGMTVGAFGVRGAFLLNGAIAIVTQLAIAWFWRRTGPPVSLRRSGMIEGS